MARIQDRAKAIELRASGMSYSQIKASLKVSKSSLSLWLRDFPLPESRLRELRDHSQIRIEKSRQTKRNKKEQRRQEVYDKVATDIKRSKDSFFVSGFYLYWGEGTKSAEYTVSFTNTDPAMVRCFVQWMSLLGVSPDKLKLKLHMYADQDEKELKEYWSHQSGVSLNNFYKTYVKASNLDRRTYKGMYGHGTCVVMYHNRDTYEYVLAGIKFLRQTYSLPGSH